MDNSHLWITAIYEQQPCIDNSRLTTAIYGQQPYIDNSRLTTAIYG